MINTDSITWYVGCVLAGVMAMLVGCSLIKDGETVNWDKVDTISSLVQTTAQVSTYAVCVKNPDLSPVFKAVGEGLVLISASPDSEQMKPEQIQNYIKDLLSEKEWGSLAGQVNGVMDTLLDIYGNFIEANQDKFTDEAKVFARVLNSMGKGLISGSVVDVASSAKATADLEKQKSELINKLKDMDFSVSED